jgi:hypothetical protein
VTAKEADWRALAAVIIGVAAGIFVSLVIFIATRPHPVFFPVTSLGYIIASGSVGAVVAVVYARVARRRGIGQIIGASSLLALALTARWFLRRIDLAHSIIHDLWVK